VRARPRPPRGSAHGLGGPLIGPGPETALSRDFQQPAVAVEKRRYLRIRRFRSCVAPTGEWSRLDQSSAASMSRDPAWAARVSARRTVLRAVGEDHQEVARSDHRPVHA
jgi:hypothetical protein